ncbi:MAG: hypothetical protein KAQ63_03070 [Candidatus Moranbacteria bacterium]|nr:hypothetical protein [Candidatus Moranbacteria bacterium]
METQPEQPKQPKDDLGLPFSPEKMEVAAVFFESLAKTIRSLKVLLNSAPVTATPINNDPISKLVPESETVVRPKAEAEKKASESTSPIEPEPVLGIPEDQIDFTDRIETITRIEEDSELGKYLTSFMEKLFIDWIPVYAKKTRRIANLSKWHQAFNLSNNYSILLWKGQGSIKSTEKIILSHFGLKLNEALNIGKAFQKDKASILGNRVANPKITKALSKVKNLRGNLILARAFLAFLRSQTPKKGKIAFCYNLGFHSSIFYQFTVVPLPKHASFATIKAARVALMLGYSLEQAIEKGLKITGEKLGNEDEPADGSSGNDDSPKSNDPNIILFDNPEKVECLIAFLKNNLAQFAENQTGESPETIKLEWLKEIELNPNDWEVFLKEKSLKIKKIKGLIETIGILQDNDLTLEAAVQTGKKILKNKGSSDDKTEKEPFRLDDEELSSEEQLHFTNFLKNFWDQWGKNKQGKSEKPFFKEFKIKKSRFENICAQRDPITVGQATALLHKINPKLTLEQVLNFKFSKEDSPEPTVNQSPTDLLSLEEQKQFTAYLNFNKKAWRPEPEHSKGVTFFSVHGINKARFEQAKIRANRDCATNLAHKIEGASLEQALRDGEEELKNPLTSA